MESRCESFSAYAVAFSVQVTYCIYQVLVKLLLRQGFQVLPFVVLRQFLGAVVLVVVCHVSGGPRLSLTGPWQAQVDPAARPLVGKTKGCSVMWTTEHRWRLALVGVGTAGHVGCLAMALSYTSAATVAVLQVLRPVCAAVVGWTVRGEVLGLLQIIGLLLASGGGIAVAATHGSDAVSDAENTRGLLGCFMTFLHCMGMATTLVQQDMLVKAGHTVTEVITHGNVLAALMCLMGWLALSSGQLETAHWLKYPINDAAPIGGVQLESWCIFFAVLVYSVSLVTVYSFFAMAWCATKLGPTQTILFMLLQSVMMLWAGHVLLGEQLFLRQVGGALALLAGVVTFVYGGARGPSAVPDAEATSRGVESWPVQQC